MEDMSKKGKRLEKENESLKRQKEATAANIIRMAEERQEWKKKTETAENKTQQLRRILQGMQDQERQVPPGMVAAVNSVMSPDHDGGEEDESAYSNEDHSDFDEEDDDTDEEQPPATAPVTYGPERPPMPAQATPAINGH